MSVEEDHPLGGAPVECAEEGDGGACVCQQSGDGGRVRTAHEKGAREGTSIRSSSGLVQYELQGGHRGRRTPDQVRRFPCPGHDEPPPLDDDQEGARC